MIDIVAKDADLLTQVKTLEEILATNKRLAQLLDKVPLLNLPNWYLGAGCISQTIWNYAHELKPEMGIKDYDLVYFDPNTSYEAEDQFIQAGHQLFSEMEIEVEIRNQARVHLWHKDHFGYPIPAYTSVENGINTWPTTATAVAVRKVKGSLQIYAPFGLRDLLSLTVRPNKVKITEEIYLKKVNRWSAVWPNLSIIPWDKS